MAPPDVPGELEMIERSITMSIHELQATVPMSKTGLDVSNPAAVEQTLADMIAELEVPEGMEAGKGGALRATITWHTRDGVEPTQDDIDLYGLMAKMILGSAAEAMGELMAEHVDPKHSAPAVDLAWGVGVYLRKK